MEVQIFEDVCVGLLNSQRQGGCHSLNCCLLALIHPSTPCLMMLGQGACQPHLCFAKSRFPIGSVNMWYKGWLPKLVSSSNTSSPRSQQILPGGLAESSFGFSRHWDTSLILLRSETPTTAEQHPSSESSASALHGLSTKFEF